MTGNLQRKRGGYSAAEVPGRIQTGLIVASWRASYCHWATRLPQQKPFHSVSPLSTRGMFAGGLRETKQKEIPIHGVSYMAMKKILDYIYTSEIELDLESVQEVLIAATLVQVSSLLFFCQITLLFVLFIYLFSTNLCPFVFSSSRLSSAFAVISFSPGWTRATF